MRSVWSVGLRVGAIVVAGALVLSACGSSSGSGSSSVSALDTSSSSAAPALTGTPIVIGAIGSESGPVAAASIQGFTVAPAWADWVNANGGINGHPVQLELADDGFDPAKAQAAAKDLIDNKKVDALLVISDFMLPSYAEYAASKGIPVMGGQANSTTWYKQSGLYTTPTDIQSGLAGIVQVAKDFGKAKKVGFAYCIEVAPCAEAIPVMQAAADKVGVDFMSLGISSTAPDYTAECLKLQQEDVDFVYVGVNDSATAKFVQSCQAQGYNPTYGTSSYLVGPAVLALTDYTAYGPAFSFPTVSDAPVVQTYTDAMTKYAKDDNWKYSTASSTWAGLEMLHKTIGTITGDVTPASVTSALNNVKDEDLGGLLADKITFTADKPLEYGSHPCYFVVSVKDGKMEAPAGLDRQCPA